MHRIIDTDLFYIFNDTGNNFTNYKGLCGNRPRITDCGNLPWSTILFITTNTNAIRAITNWNLICHSIIPIENRCGLAAVYRRSRQISGQCWEFPFLVKKITAVSSPKPVPNPEQNCCNSALTTLICRKTAEALCSFDEKRVAVICSSSHC